MITQARFAAASRLLHWLMAPMIITMLFIGIGMAASVSRRYDLMVSIHRPLGFARHGSIPAALRRQSIAYLALCAHADHAAGRLGHAVGRALPDRALRPDTVTADLAA